MRKYRIEPENSGLSKATSSGLGSSFGGGGSALLRPNSATPSSSSRPGSALSLTPAGSVSGSGQAPRTLRTRRHAPSYDPVASGWDRAGANVKPDQLRQILRQHSLSEREVGTLLGPEDPDKLPLRGAASRGLRRSHLVDTAFEIQSHKLKELGTIKEPHVNYRQLLQEQEQMAENREASDKKYAHMMRNFEAMRERSVKGLDNIIDQRQR